MRAVIGWLDVMAIRLPQDSMQLILLVLVVAVIAG